MNIAALTVIGTIIGSSTLVVKAAVVRLPTTLGHTTATFISLAAALFVVGGGTHIVRGVLDKVEALPKITKGATSEQIGATNQPPANVDVPEYNRGRTIGNIERLLMLVIIGVGSYEALGFLIAAKGLIRAPEFEDRDFAEYFIVGSLTSAAVALFVGIPLKALVTVFWAK